MAEPTFSTHRVRVGEFQVDLDSGEVLGAGTCGRLQVQSLELLKALLERPGMMVSREQLRRRLWPNDTFVDFDHGLNAAVRRLRETLGDSADSPRFIETIPRKGYRLVAATDVDTPAPTPPITVAPIAGVEPNRTTGQAAPPVRRIDYLTIAIGLCAIAAAGAWLTLTTPPAGSRPPFASFTVDVPAGWNIQTTDHLALSPDGRYIAFTATGPDHRGALWLRALAEPAPRQVSGSEAAAAPFWSADGTRVGFFANGLLRSVTVADGRVQTLTAAAPPVLQGGAGAWTTAGDILFMALGSSLGTPAHAATLRRLDASTGAVQPFAPSSGRRDYIDHVAPSAVPGTDAFTFIRWNPSTLDMTAHVGEVGTTGTKDLGRTDSRVVVTESGHAVFVRNGVLVAQSFDVETRRLLGAPFPIAQEVAVHQPMLGHFATSSDVIVYLTPTSMTYGTQLMLVDRNGAAKRMIADGAEFGLPRVSPDGTRVAVARRDPVSGTRDIWVLDISGKPPVRLTYDNHDDMSPAWSADGSTILFTSDRSGERDIYRKDVAGRGAEMPIFSSSDSKSLNAWSPDGRFFIYDNGARASIESRGRINKDLLTVSLSGAPTVRSLAATPAAESAADISPDGTLVAYQSSETGRAEVFVETFPEKAERWQVTTGGAMEPMWRGDGRELFFLSPDNEVCAIDVERSNGAVRMGTPRVLFRLQNPPSTTRHYVPLPDGQRFITLAAPPRLALQRMTVLMNWRSALPH